MLLILWQRVDVTRLLQTVGTEPRIAAVLPLAEFFLWHGIGEPGRDEVGDVRLPPVWEVATMDVKLVVGAEESGSQSGFGFSRRVFFWFFVWIRIHGL